jgi:hypothetical protein
MASRSRKLLVRIFQKRSLEFGWIQKLVRQDCAINYWVNIARHLY